jgi:cytochrome b561
MQRSDTPARYTRTAIALHWLIAILVIGQFAWGWYMQTIPKQPTGLRADAFNLHKSVGMSLFVLMALRLAWRAEHPPPPLPPMPRWKAYAAALTHGLLYAVLLIQPVFGYLGSEFSGYPVKYFGMTLPGWAGKDVALKDLMSVAHLVNSWVLAVLVTLHVAAALKHALVDRDGLLARMGVGRS